MNTYYEFWSHAFALPVGEFESPHSKTVMAGKYLERYGDEFVFQFRDLSTGKEILSHSQSWAAILQDKNLPRDSKSLNLKLSYDDIDFGFNTFAEFRPVSIDRFKIEHIVSDDERLRLFYTECSDDDRDTLDLTFDNETAFGIVSSDRVLGVARAAQTKSTPQLVDITVLVAKSARGQGLSTPLVSHLLSQTLALGQVPKYRVGHENIASQAIARRLGLHPMFRVKTWCLANKR